ncbi:MAG: trimeric intracellular cation channel family protein [Jatrophihabitans sp.]|uniref:trimeric intracellular cation channel family protein n=1 Tax=Jatrophihabitans sp. TaxID=1932789 RepID=UPI003F7EC051
MPAAQLALDLVGSAVFALSGALAGVRARLDVFGVVVVGTVTAIGGGILRDVLLGATPPASLRHWFYLAVPTVASVVVFVWHPRVSRLGRPIVVLDAAGLGLFTVTGTRLALNHGLGPAGAVALGILTGIGGGVLRDVLLGQIPLVLRREIYALASAVGAVLVVAAHEAGALTLAWEIPAAVAVFVVRVLAARRRWSMPTPRMPER